MATTSPSKYVDFDEYIDFQLRKTRANIKTTDILTALAGVGTMFLAYLLVFVVFDHWIIDGGFSTGARWLMLGGLLVASAAWVVWRVVLPSRRNVTGLYAAKAIEETEPELKHSLMNLVDLKRAGRPVPEEIERALQKRAAVTLHQGDVDAAIDRRPLMRLSYALLALVVVCCMYAVFSPKRISASVWRALFPASSTAVDTAIKIDRVAIVHNDQTKDPDISVAARTKLKVIADLDFNGDPPESVTLYYSTADRKFQDVEVVMKRDPEVAKRYFARLKGGFGRGVEQSTSYRIEAGDAKAGPFQITVVRPPVATVRKIRYDYPAYMQREPRTQDGGHIETWEGTDVTVNAETDKPVRKAWLVFMKTEDPSRKPVHRVAMSVTGGTNLSVKLTREISLCNGSHPHFYHIECEADSEFKDPDPAVYGVTIRQDRRPTIQLLDPAKNKIELPANVKSLPVLYKASDDFAVRFVTLKYRITRKGEAQGREMPEPLFEGSKKNIQKSFSWPLAHHIFQPGDEVEFYLHARDNMPPRTRKAPWCGADQVRLNENETRKVVVRFIEKQDQRDVDQQIKQKQQQQQQKQDEHEKNQGDRQPNQKDDAAGDGAKKDKRDDGMPPENKQQRNGKKKKDDGGKGQGGDPKAGGKNGKGQNDPQNNKGQQADSRSGGQGDGQKPPQTNQERTDQLLKEHKEEQQRRQKNKQKAGSKSQKSSNQSGNKTKSGSKQGTQQQPKNGMGQQPKGDKSQDPMNPKNNGGSDEKKKKEKNPNGGGAKQPNPKQQGMGNKQPTQPDGGKGMGDDKTQKKDGTNGKGMNDTSGDGNKSPKNGAGNPKKKPGPGMGQKDKQNGMGGGNSNGMKDKNDGPTNGTTDQQGTQKTGSKKNGDGSKRQSKSDGMGNERNVEDSGKPATKKKAQGSETGKVSPEKDPNVDATQSNDPSKLKKKKDAKPTTRQRTGDEPKKKVGSENPGAAKSKAKSQETPVDSKTQKPNQADGKKARSKTANKTNDVSKEQTPAGKKRGQKSDRPNAGQNGMGTPQNQGTPGSKQKGMGDTTPKSGSRQSTNKQQTGKAGNKPGMGSSQKSGAGKKPGGQKSGKNANSKQGKGGGNNPANSGNSPGNSGDVPNSKLKPNGDPGKQRIPGGNGKKRSGKAESPMTHQEREKADLKYGREATNLVLDKLGDKVKRGELTDEDLKRLNFKSKQQVIDYIKSEKKRINESRDAQTREYLKSIRYRDFQKNLKKRTGVGVRKRAIDGVGTDAKEDIPPHLRQYYKAFQKSVTK